MKSMEQAGQEGHALLTEMEWGAERRAMETLDASLAGRRILVMDVDPAKKGELGYTSKGSVIHVAREHEYYERLTRQEASVFRFGVNVHEALHQVYTDFDSFYAMADRIPDSFEQEMFAQIFNLVEDPAIENFADQVVGGFALDALYFHIEKIYEAALPVSGPQNHGQALEEYLDALIQFGDRGIIKGGFSSDVAREYFNRTAPIIYRAVNEPDGSERVRLSMEVYKTVKTLWAGRPASRTRQALEGVTRRYAKSKTSGSGSGRTPQKAGDARNRKREKEICKQKKEAEEALRKDAGFAPYGEEADHGDDAGKNSQGKNKTEEKTDIRKNSGRNPGQENTENYKFPADNGFSQKDIIGRNGDDGNGSVFQYDPQIADKFAKALKSYLEQGETMAKPDAGEENPESYAETIQFRDRQFSGVKEKNLIASPGNMGDHYADILNTTAWITGPFITQLKKIFINDRGGKAYTQRGKISMKRASSGRTTTRTFERRILPGDKADMCLMLLIDLSGSMNGNKGQAAKLAALVLCETFAYFKIPVYCMGFQNIHGIDAYQTHFVRWRNSMEERMSILSAAPGGNNFDSYSIRYASEALRKRPEKHKLMCVISDGLPSHYFTGEAGIQENAKAIQDARLTGADVFGIAVSIGETDKFRKMYGKDYFINITRPADLADQAADLIRTVVKGW